MSYKIPTRFETHTQNVKMKNTKPTRFEVHAHSDYSNIRLVDAISTIEELIQTAHDKGLSGIALTDHEFVGNAIDWIDAEEQLKAEGKISQNFKCALGNEIYLVGSREPDKINKYYHFILIAKDTRGHEALRNLSSTAWYNSFRSRGVQRVPTLYSELEAVMNEYPGSIIATSACLGGELANLTTELINLEDQLKTANPFSPKYQEIDEQKYSKKLEISDFIQFCKSLFKDDFYVEIAPSLQNDQVRYNKKIIQIAEALKVKIVFGTDAHYAKKEDRIIHKAYLNSKQGEREIDAFYSATYLMDYAEVRELTPYLSDEQVRQYFTNSLEIMNKIGDYSLKHDPIIPKEEVKYYPKKEYSKKDIYPNIDWYLNSEHEQDRYWINTILDAAKEQGYTDEVSLQRIDTEADIQHFISDKIGDQVSAYHNTMEYYIDLFWECGSIVGPGRGSATGWLTNMLLGITQVDPLKWGLNEWRYLNKERVEMPDIDVDVAPSRRPLIFKKIREHKGETGLLQICTFSTEGTRSAIQTACRGYRSKEYPNGIDTDIAHYMSGLIPEERGFLWSLNDVLHGNEDKDRKPVKSFINEVLKYPGLLDIMQKIEGLIKGRSQHASGVILYNQEVYKTNAIMRSPSGDLTTQFSLFDSEAVGDTKFDFLVTEISDKIIACIELLQEDELIDSELTLREVYNQHLHPNVINLDDDRIWNSLENVSTMDTFQFSNESGRQAAKLIKPRNPIETTAANAL